MAIIYTLNKILDNHILNVSQDTSYELFNVSDNKNISVTSGVIINAAFYTLPIIKDGKYTIVLKVLGQQDVTHTFNVIKFLQNSIISEAKQLICGEVNPNCNGSTVQNCLTSSAKKALLHKSLSTKLFSFEALAIPTYIQDRTAYFSSIIQNGVKQIKCKMQENLNIIIQDECITGSTDNTDNLYKLYVALYWIGMYFIEEDIASNSTTELIFVKQKFKYDSIINCLCSTCLDVNAIKPTGITVITSLITVTSFQFANATLGIADVALITPAYLTANGTTYSEANMLIGESIVFVNVGRIGFAIKGLQNGYKILSILGDDITGLFDNSYDAVNDLDIYIAKEFSIPGTIFYKFVKI